MPSEGPISPIKAEQWKEFNDRVDSGFLDDLIIEARNLEYKRLYAAIKDKSFQQFTNPANTDELISMAEKNFDHVMLNDPSATTEERRRVSERIVDRGEREMQSIPPFLHPGGPIGPELRAWFKGEPENYKAFLARKNK